MQRTLSAKQVISDAANCFGPAHYDESASEMLEMFQNSTGQVAKVLVDFGEVVQKLSDWVLWDLARRGLLR